MYVLSLGAKGLIHDLEKVEVWMKLLEIRKALTCSAVRYSLARSELYHSDPEAPKLLDKSFCTAQDMSIVVSSRRNVDQVGTTAPDKHGKNWRLTLYPNVRSAEEGIHMNKKKISYLRKINDNGMKPITGSYGLGWIITGGTPSTKNAGISMEISLRFLRYVQSVARSLVSLALGSSLCI